MTIFIGILIGLFLGWHMSRVYDGHAVLRYSWWRAFVRQLNHTLYQSKQNVRYFTCAVLATKSLIRKSLACFLLGIPVVGVIE